MKKLLFLVALGSISGWFCNLAIAQTEIIVPDPEIQFRGTVVARACNIAPESLDQSVDMDTIIVKAMYRNQIRRWPFYINLTDCKTNIFKTATVTFTGTEDSELTGKLAINNGANGVAIAIADDKNVDIDLGTPSSATTLSNGDNTLKFNAYVLGRPSAIQNRSITEGQFSSIANFVVSYQ
ncbi:fimbrial protein [Serratia aquatilis]|uniref:Fimbrial protein n=1 Tax=Serratia aquatilis TaxID=1737515 RepID=A0ABV6EKG2_9GAMM